MQRSLGLIFAWLRFSWLGNFCLGFSRPAPLGPEIVAPASVWFGRSRLAALLACLVAISAVARADDVAPTSVQSVAPDIAEAILGLRVTDAEGKGLGRLVDVLVDENGQPQAAVIDFGGFMGVGNRKVAVHWSTLHFKPAEGKHVITLDMTPDQIKSAPEYSSMDKPAPVVTPADATPTAR